MEEVEPPLAWAAAVEVVCAAFAFFFVVEVVVRVMGDAAAFRFSLPFLPSVDLDVLSYVVVLVVLGELLVFLNFFGFCVGAVAEVDDGDVVGEGESSS